MTRRELLTTAASAAPMRAAAPMEPPASTATTSGVSWAAVSRSAITRRTCGATLRFRYRVVIHEGPYEPDAIEASYKGWIR
jgi:hypothetical protein